MLPWVAALAPSDAIFAFEGCCNSVSHDSSAAATYIHRDKDERARYFVSPQSLSQKPLITTVGGGDYSKRVPYRRCSPPSQEAKQSQSQPGKRLSSKLSTAHRSFYPSVMSQFTLALLAASLASSALATPLSTSPYTSQRRPYLGVAPLVEVEHVHGTINNSYIVVLKEDVSPSLMQNHLNFLQSAHQSDSLLGDDVASGLRHVYDTHLKGYAGEFTDGVVDQIRRMPEVDFIERDQVVHTTDDIKPVDTQRGAPWVCPSFFRSSLLLFCVPQGLARISHRKKLTFGTFASYVYDSHGGEGVDVYIIDTGINTDHEEFEGRASWGKTISPTEEDEDGNGHGSHCAGTIGSRKYGVAKKANLIAVKVLGANGSGPMSDVIAGVAWASDAAELKAAAARAEFAATGKTAHKGSVGNMSLGGSKSPSLDIIVDRSVEGGLHFSVAAGM